MLTKSSNATRLLNLLRKGNKNSYNDNFSHHFTLQVCTHRPPSWWEKLSNAHHLDIMATWLTWLSSPARQWKSTPARKSKWPRPASPSPAPARLASPSSPVVVAVTRTHYGGAAQRFSRNMRDRRESEALSVIENAAALLAHTSPVKLLLLPLPPLLLLLPRWSEGKSCERQVNPLHPRSSSPPCKYLPGCVCSVRWQRRGSGASFPSGEATLSEAVHC